MIKNDINTILTNSESNQHMVSISSEINKNNSHKKITSTSRSRIRVRTGYNRQNLYLIFKKGSPSRLRCRLVWQPEVPASGCFRQQRRTNTVNRTDKRVPNHELSLRFSRSEVRQFEPNVHIS